MSRITNADWLKHYKYGGVAVTGYTPNMGASGFDSSQGFVSTFSGLNVVRRLTLLPP
jgi:hypothetical protein